METQKRTTEVAAAELVEVRIPRLPSEQEKALNNLERISNILRKIPDIQHAPLQLATAKAMYAKDLVYRPTRPEHWTTYGVFEDACYIFFQEDRGYADEVHTLTLPLPYKEEKPALYTIEIISKADYNFLEPDVSLEGEKIATNAQARGGLHLMLGCLATETRFRWPHIFTVPAEQR
jgi:hypothetical protein